MIKKKKTKKAPEKKGDGKLTPEGLEAACKAFTQALTDSSIPFFLVAMHPQDEGNIVASGGNPEEVIHMSQLIEIDAKEQALSLVKENPEAIAQFAGIIKNLNETFEPERKRLGEELGALMGQEMERKMEDLSKDAPPEVQALFSAIKKMVQATGGTVRFCEIEKAN